MKEFKINDYLSLRLEDRSTNVYIKNNRFRQCKILLLNSISNEINNEELESIDEAAERHNYSFEDTDNLKKIEIIPEEEFWAHCSNLQVWSENQYDTRLLHRNLAFPLLKKLTEIGDPLAKKVFKEEIAKRFSSGVVSVMLYLINSRYLNILEKEEFETILNSMPNLFTDLSKKLGNEKSEEAEEVLYYLLELLQKDNQLLERLVMDPKVNLIENLIMFISDSYVDSETIFYIVEIFEKLKKYQNEVGESVRKEIIFQFNNGSSRILLELIFDKFFRFLDKFSIESLLKNNNFRENLIYLIEKYPEYLLDSLIEFFIMIYDSLSKQHLVDLLYVMNLRMKKDLKNNLKNRIKMYNSMKNLYPVKDKRLEKKAIKLLNLVNELIHKN